MFWDRYFALCHSVGKTPNRVGKELGVSSGTITFWKKGKVPHHGTLLKIADYFGVTVDGGRPCRIASELYHRIRFCASKTHKK